MAAAFQSAEEWSCLNIPSASSFVYGAPAEIYTSEIHSYSGISPTIDVIGKSAIVGIFYFVGFGMFCLESLLSIGVIQQVYMYFRGSGKAAEMKREAARSAMSSTF